MDIELGKVYLDRQGRKWKIIKMDGPRLYPVAAARWEGKSYQVRCFQLDGRFEKDRDDPHLDLVQLATESPA